MTLMPSMCLIVHVQCSLMILISVRMISLEMVSKTSNTMFAAVMIPMALRLQTRFIMLLWGNDDRSYSKAGDRETLSSVGKQTDRAENGRMDDKSCVSYFYCFMLTCFTAAIDIRHVALGFLMLRMCTVTL